MGSTTSRQRTSQPKHSALDGHRLSERKAWAIALTWRNQLRGCVRLETETEHSFESIIPVFEWVAFVFNGSEDVTQGLTHVKGLPETVAYARAATIVWFALSCCPGYSGTENPGFWRRVFFEFLYPKDFPPLEKMVLSASRPQRVTTDAVRFFTETGKPFPRIRLVVGKENTTTTAEQIFLGHVHQPNKSRDRQLRRVLTKLQPFIRGSHWTRHVPVQADVALSPIEKAVALLEEASRAFGMREVDPEPSKHRSFTTNLPRLELLSMKLELPYFGYLDRLDSAAPLGSVGIVCNEGLWNIVRDHRLSRGFLDRLNSSSSSPSPSTSYPRWCVSPLEMAQVNDFSTSQAAILCSALPHLTSIRAVNLPPFREAAKETPVSIASDWTWLGYAIFHPDAASHSGFNTLDLQLNAVRPADVAALQSMAVGNNLLGGNVSGYLEGRVLPSNDVLKRPQDDDEVIYTFVSETWVSLCVPAVDALEYQEWICVVVPGYGSGWIRRSDIIEVRCRAPGKSCIRTLRMTLWSATIPEELLTGFLSAIGRDLTSLDLQSVLAIPTDLVQVIMRHCPLLKSLRLCHDGAFWADEMLATERPRLEQLELTLDRSSWREMRLQELQPVCLPHLRALRVITQNQDHFKYIEEILAAFLGEHRRLEYLHWSCVTDMYPKWLDSSFAGKNEATKKFLRQLPAHQQLYEGPFRLVCRLAFLSVMRSETRHSRMSRLGDDVVKLVFQYATSTSRREFAIFP